MQTTIRAIREEEIPSIAEFLSQEEWVGSSARETVEKSLTAQFNCQSELLLGVFSKENNLILGAIAGRGQGDTVLVVHLRAVKEGFYGLIKKLITAEEKAARHYGYSQIFLTAMVAQKNFLITLGYKPRLLFTFSSHRKELFDIFSQLYPLWIEVGGQVVKVLLGGDHLEKDVKTSLEKHPVKTENLFLKHL